MQEMNSIDFGPFPPVNTHLGPVTLGIVNDPDFIESYVIKQKSARVLKGNLSFVALAIGPRLSADQVREVQELVLRPESYYNGRPIFRRLPSQPDFALRWWKSDKVLDLLIDLHNPGWQFHCDQERYRDWHWAEGKFKQLAKILFPELASSRGKSIWRKDAINSLTEVCRITKFDAAPNERTSE